VVREYSATLAAWLVGRRSECLALVLGRHGGHGFAHIQPGREHTVSACEECWTEANRKALMLGGSVVERYQAELAAHPEHEASPEGVSR
jgi:hypothetical protein